MPRVSWLFIALLACGIAILVAAEWPRLGERAGLQARERRRRARRKSNLKLLRTETDDFEASVQRDLERLPTIEERDRRKRTLTVARRIRVFGRIPATSSMFFAS